jgi:hypothetical protein
LVKVLCGVSTLGSVLVWKPSFQQLSDEKRAAIVEEAESAIIEFARECKGAADEASTRGSEGGESALEEAGGGENDEESEAESDAADKSAVEKETGIEALDGRAEAPSTPPSKERNESDARSRAGPLPNGTGTRETTNGDGEKSALEDAGMEHDNGGASGGESQRVEIVARRKQQPKTSAAKPARKAPDLQNGKLKRPKLSYTTSPSEQDDNDAHDNDSGSIAMVDVNGGRGFEQGHMTSSWRHRYQVDQEWVEKFGQLFLELENRVAPESFAECTQGLADAYSFHKIRPLNEVPGPILWKD